ncbi:hypothetical protein J1N35_006174 [Gossypium stocksii]|uniref:EF-hand domain-containing protein n=1 Tax=Gossypium stocksii TaxID=47602 RepID=A0A9D3WED4_9ROSI|nr:hypothetical protein J1N35_006174 [Gossypium stocksii]
MKLINRLSPKHLFRSNKKGPSTVSKFDPSSYTSSGSAASSSSESVSSVHKGNQYPLAATVGTGTPTSVLPETSVDCEVEALLSKFARQPPSQEEISSMLGEVDGDGDGCISLETLMNQVAGSACEPELRETFDIFDTDHDGKITAEELMAFYKEKLGDERCTLEDCRLMIASVDKNGDGFVCFDDFSRMMEIQG